MRFLVGTASLITVTCLVNVSIAQATTLVLNGSFELPAINATRTDGRSLYRYERISSLDSWTINGSSIAVLDTVPGQWESADGDQYIEVETRTISQAVSTAPKKDYILSFSYAANPFGTGLDDSLEVLWNGNVIADLDLNDSTSGDLNWQQYYFQVKSVNDSSLLAFRDGSTGVSLTGPFLDSVSLVAVPEPTTTLGSVMALISAFLLKRAKQKHQSMES